MKNKIHKIDSFESLINTANEENFEFLSKDFLLWLNFTIGVISELRKKDPKKYKRKTNWQVMQSSFFWVDDGKSEINEVHLIE